MYKQRLNRYNHLSFNENKKTYTILKGREEIRVGKSRRSDKSAEVRDFGKSILFAKNKIGISGLL